MQVDLRKPEFVMKLGRLGSFHQSKLSFLRSFIREFKDWDFQTHILELDNFGFGHGVYVVQKGNKQYSLVCFSNHLDANERSDRVIATKWDASLSYMMEFQVQKIFKDLKITSPFKSKEE